MAVCALLLVGGNSNNGSNCGVSCSNSNNGFSNSNSNIGARLEICMIWCNFDIVEGY